MKTYLAAFALAAMAATTASAQQQATPTLLGGTGLTTGAVAGAIAGAVVLGVVVNDDESGTTTSTPTD